MIGFLGEKIGEGAAADVHAWAAGQVIKLFRPGVSPRIGRHEASVTRAVLAAGAPAPEVFGEATVDDRFGIILSRHDGPTLRDLSRSGAMTSQAVGAVLADLAMAVHVTPPPPEVFSLHDWMAGALPLIGDRLPEHIATGVMRLIDALPPSDILCHCDLHPGNVIMTAQGPTLIDWSGAVRAPAALDLAVSHVILTELVADMVHDPQRPRAAYTAMLSEYARLSGRSPEALTAAMAPCLPIVSVLILLGGAAPAQRERMIRRVEAALSRQA